MDPPRVDELLSRAVDDQVAEYREWRLAMEAVADRVERLEAAVRALCDDLDSRVEGATRTALSELLEQLQAEIRRLSAGTVPLAPPADVDRDLDLRDDAGLPYADADADDGSPVPGRRGRRRRR